MRSFRCKLCHKFNIKYGITSSPMSEPCSFDELSLEHSARERVSTNKFQLKQTPASPKNIGLHCKLS